MRYIKMCFRHFNVVVPERDKHAFIERLIVWATDLEPTYVAIQHLGRTGAIQTTGA